jgi:hypothetical protein
MTRSSFADLLAGARQMATAMQANAERLTGRGISAEFMQKGATLAAQLEAADAKQERLKAEAKAATTQVEELQAATTAWLAEADSSVKLIYRDEKDKWGEFGIKAKR